MESTLSTASTKTIGDKSIHRNDDRGDDDDGGDDDDEDHGNRGEENSNRAILKEKLNRVFQEVDRNSDGVVNRQELIVSIRKDEEIAKALGVVGKVAQESEAQTEIERLFQGLDSDSSKEISLTEFMLFQTQLVEIKVEDTQLKSAVHRSRTKSALRFAIVDGGNADDKDIEANTKAVAGIESGISASAINALAPSVSAPALAPASASSQESLVNPLGRQNTDPLAAPSRSMVPLPGTSAADQKQETEDTTTTLLEVLEELWEDAELEDEGDLWANVREALLESREFCQYLIMRPTDIHHALASVHVRPGTRIKKSQFLVFFSTHVKAGINAYKAARSKESLTPEDRQLLSQLFGLYKEKTGEGTPVDELELGRALAALDSEIGIGDGTVDRKNKKSARRMVRKKALDESTRLSFADFCDLCISSDGFAKLLARRKLARDAQNLPVPDWPPPKEIQSRTEAAEKALFMGDEQ